MGATFKETHVFTGVSLAIAQKCVADSNRSVVVALGAIEKVSVQGVSVGTTAWSTAEVCLRFSNSINGPWINPPYGTISIAAPAFFDDGSGVAFFDVSAFGYMALVTITAQPGVVADFAICGFGHK
jgi:hypothetical protein